MATKKTTDEIIEKNDAVQKPEDDDRVLIMIPYIEGEDPEVTVGVNYVYTKIQKGKQVRVKKEVAEVLQHSNEMVMEALENRRRLKNQKTDL